MSRNELYLAVFLALVAISGLAAAVRPNREPAPKFADTPTLSPQMQEALAR